MDEQRKYAILFAATILAARKLNEIGNKPCPARVRHRRRSRECQRMLEKINARWPIKSSQRCEAPCLRGMCLDGRNPRPIQERNPWERDYFSYP